MQKAYSVMPYVESLHDEGHEGIDKGSLRRTKGT